MKIDNYEEFVLARSIRIDNNSLILSVLSESFLLRLLGQSNLYIHGTISQNDWKNILERIVKALEKAIEINFDSDGFHVTIINNYIDRLKQACKSKNIADIEIIFSLTGIIFELLGGLPDYSQRKILNRKSDYSLDSFRELRYYQAPYHKARTILEASRYKPFCDYHKHGDLLDTYYSNYNGDSEGFIDWYKKNYPEAYMKIF